jgi:subtilisin family serine protease
MWSWMVCDARKLSATALLAALALGCVDSNPPTTVDDEAAPDPAAVAGDRYIVMMKEGAGGSGSDGMSANLVRMGGKLERVHADIGVFQVRKLTREQAADLAKQAGVESVVKDRTIQLILPGERRRFDARRAGFGPQTDQSGAAFFDQFQWNLRRIRADDAWTVSKQGKGVTVCILDSGVDPRHIELQGKLDRNISASFVASERADRDFFSHGTDMASIVSSNGIAMASVAPDARLCSVKVSDFTGSGTFGDLIAGIMYVGTVGGVDVANMSLGALLPANEPDVRQLTRATQRAVNFSTRRGVLFVASSGNQGADLNDPSIVHLPSDLDNVLSVGATGPINQKRFDRVASYSNFGRAGTDVFAPGGEFAFANNVLEDLILAACSPSFDPGDGSEPCLAGNEFFLEAGTSPAAAHVSGLAAVIESELPGDQSPAELTQCILQNADDLPKPLITAEGRINVLKAQDCGAPGNLMAQR